MVGIGSLLAFNLGNMLRNELEDSWWRYSGTDFVRYNFIPFLAHRTFLGRGKLCAFLFSEPAVANRPPSFQYGRRA